MGNGIMKQIRNSSTATLVTLGLFVTLFVLFMYTFLHESGHAITGLLFGQSLTEFNVNFWNFSAHVGMVGGKLTQSQLAVQSAAGAILPLLLWMIFISVVPRKSNFTLEVLKLISSMAIVNTLLAWIVLPFLFMLGKAPPDDVTNFLRYSQIPPLLLIVTAIILYIGGWLLFLSKIDGLRNEFLLFNQTAYEKLLTGARTTIPVMASLMLFCAVLAFALNISASKKQLNKFTPPQDFEHIAQIDLPTRAYYAETLKEFSLENSTYVSVFIAIHDIDTQYFDLSITGPNGFRSVVLHGEGYNAFQDGGLWEQNLNPGTYQVILTSYQSPGTASVYLKTH